MSDKGTMGSNPVGTDTNGHEPATTSRRRKRLAGAAALLLAGGIAGGALAATGSASAAGTSSPDASTAAPSPGAPGRDDSATPVRPGEKALTGTNLSALKAAALKAVPGGTVYRVETDHDGSAYEAHMTKTDGTHVTVEFDKNLKVTEVDAGQGAGLAGEHHGAAHHDGPSGHDDGSPSAGKYGS
jgi:hypothetical protein